MTQYTLNSRAAYGVFVIALPCLLIALGAPWVYRVVFRPEQSAVGIWFPVLWFAAMLWECRRAMKTPYRIEVLPDGAVRLVGLMATTVLPKDVLAIRAKAGDFVELKHRRGKVRILQRFTNFKEFVSELKRVNPDVEIRL